MVVSDTAEGQDAATNERMLEMFLICCQVFFSISIIAKALALIGHLQVFAKPDYVLGISQITVMQFACFLELLVVGLLASNNAGSATKLGTLLAISSGFLTYHLLAWAQGTPTCPCFGNLIAQATAAKISFAAALLLFSGSVLFLADRRQRWHPRC